MINKTWRLIETGIGSAGWNMAVDEALLREYEEERLPIIRLYRWESALSLGRFQKPRESLDIEKLQNKRVPFVRRMTGGGILVHGGDISYSLILPRTFLKEKSIKEGYRFLCGFLINLYEGLGLKAGFSLDKAPKSSNVCLAGNETYDIIIEGRKMGGNAQRHTKKALFQHGTVPMSYERFEPFFLEDSGLERAATLQRLDVLLTFEDISKLLTEVFCETFDVDVVPETLTAQERQSAEMLLKEKYSKKEWNIYAKET